MHGLANLFEEASLSNSDVLGICETWAIGQVPSLPAHWASFNCLCASAAKDKTRGRPSGGLLLLSKNEAEEISISDWWIFARIRLGADFIIFGIVYFKPALDLSIIFDMLAAVLADIQEAWAGTPLVLAGDFNARVGSEGIALDDITEGTCLFARRCSLDTTVNARGRALDNFMSTNGFLLVNGRTLSDCPGRNTFCGEVGVSLIDQFWVSVDDLAIVEDLKVEIGVSGSDHFPVSLFIQAQQNDSIDSTSCLPSAAPTGPPRLVWDSSKNVDYAEALQPSGRLALDFDSSSVGALNDNLCDAILDVAGSLSLIKKAHGNPRATISKPWFDAECRGAKWDVGTALVECERTHFAAEQKATYLACKKSFKALTAKKKQAFQREIRNKLANVNSASDFWKTVSLFKPKHSSAACISLEGWSLFYEGLYPQCVLDNLLFLTGSKPELDREISIAEVKLALREAKSGKAPGIDLIPNDFLKRLPSNWVSYLARLFNRILAEEATPDAWSIMLLMMLFKKGDKYDPSNYKGIALVSCIAKLFTAVIKNRLEPWAEQHGLFPECQAGFRKGRGCADNIFTLQATLQIQLLRGNDTVWCLFVDFKRAFDSVPHVPHLTVRLLGGAFC